MNVNAGCRGMLLIGVSSMVFVASGCSKAKTLEKMAISGEVTYNGEPLESGEISFKPAEDSKVPPAAAIISRGEYKAEGRAGIAAGTYRVEIRAYDAGDELPGIQRPPPMPGVIPMGRQNYLPEKFNTKSTLETVTIEAGEKNVVRNFDLED